MAKAITIIRHNTEEWSAPKMQTWIEENYAVVLPEPTIHIASCYFIIKILKPLLEISRFECEANVPHFQNRTSHALSLLIKPHEVLGTANNTAFVSTLHYKCQAKRRSRQFLM